MSESCKSCRFFNLKTLSYRGDCRAHPATLPKHEEDWCGEYEAKAVKPPEPVLSFHKLAGKAGGVDDRALVSSSYSSYSNDVSCSRCEWKGHAGLNYSVFEDHVCTKHPKPTKDDS